MAYGLKYQSELFTRNGHTFRLLIHEDGFVGCGVTVIGNLRALTVEIQGGSEGIDSPVIKTSLSWSVADEQDKGLVDGVRYGHWEDLYTADSTHFKVVLQRDGSNWWTGYLTPDSWHDNLQYNSYISFTARDNIGHLQDFEYDGPSGLVSVKGIVEAALAKIGFGMGLTVFDKTKWMKAGTNNGYEGFLVDSNIFAGKNWYQALESVLAGFGLVMRFIGSNAFGICPIRYLPDLMGTAKTAQFVNRSGVRELSPAYKQIVESGSYELSPYDTPTFSEGDFLVNRPLDIYTLNKDGWTANRINALRPYDTAIESTLGYMLTPVSGEKDRYALFRAWSTAGGAVTHTVRAGNNSAISISYSFRGLFQRNAGAWLNNPLLAPRKTGINVYVTWTDTDGGVQYLNKDGQWQDEQTVAAEYESQNVEDSQAQRRAWNTDGNISLTTPDSTGSLSLRFEGTADIKGTEYDGLYILLGGISAAVESAAVPNGWKVTTIYDDTQNTTLKRDIDFGVVPTWLKGPGTISNGIYLASAVSGVSAVYNATWGAEPLSLPIPVLNALQILAMHAKANSVFTGELMAADGSELTFSERWTAYGKNCLLVGGTLDLMTGRITDAKLVEYDTYGAIWGGISDIDYNVITGGDGNYGNASPSGTTGGGGNSGPVGAGIRALSLSMSEQFSVDGSPVSGQSGELTVTLAAGYIIPTQSAFNAKYEKPPGGIPKSDLASNVQTSLGKADTALQNGDIKTLTIQKNGTQVGTYNPLTASTINITDVASASTLAALKSWIESMFEKDTTSLPGTTLIKAKYSLYSEGAITAGGVGSGGSGSTGALYTCVDVTAYNSSKVGRDSTHPAQSGDLLAYDGSKWHAVVAPATGVTSFGGKSGEITLGSNLAMTGNQVGLTGVITTSNIAQQTVTALATPSLRTETDIVESGLRTYYGIGGTWTGSITSMAYAAIIALGSGTGRGLQIWARRGAGITASLHYRVSNEAQTGWAAERIIIDSENYTTYCATAAQGTKANAAYGWGNHADAGYLTGITKAMVDAVGANADTLDGQHASYFQPLATAINTGNIASQSVARAHGLTSVSITASFDLDTRLSGGGVVGNYGSTNYWVNGPSGMGYGSVAQIIASADQGNKLALQLAWDITHASSTPTRRLWFRSSNDGWGHDWKEIYHSGNSNKSDVAWACSTLTANSKAILGSLYDNSAALGRALSYGVMIGVGSVYGTAIWSTSNGNGHIQVQRFDGTATAYNLCLQELGGNVGIGTASPSQKLHVVGNIIATGAITAGGASDARLKDNIRNLANAVTVLKSLRPVSFDWNATATSNYSALKGHDVGLVAQDVEPYIPSAIGSIFGDYKRLDYTKVTPYLIAGWQEHETEIDRLRRRVAELERRLNIN